MSQKSFADLGLSQPVVGALAERGMHVPLRDPVARHRGRPRRRRRAGQVPHGLGQDDRLHRTRSSTCSSATPAGRPRSCSRRRVSSSSQIVEDARPLADARGLNVASRLRRRRLRQADQERPRRPPRGRHARAASRTCSRAARSRSPTSRSSSSTRPTGCSTWASARPSTGSSPSAPPTARRCSSAPRSTVRPAASPRSTPTDAVTHEHRPAPEHVGEIEHRFRAVDRDTRLDALVDELNDSERAIVFVRTKRGADRLVKRLGTEGVRAVAMHGNKSQNQRERALAEFTSGKVDTLVATDVAARGIDVSRHLARDQLRRARRPRELRAPHRPHGPRGPHRHRDHVRRGRAGPRRRQDRPRRCACTREFERAGFAPAARPHATSGGNTRRSRPRSRRPRSRA